MQQREDLYPATPDFPHPLVFSPERWDTWQPKPWQYLPFNGGPRICVGQQFALTEIGAALSFLQYSPISALTLEVAFTVVRILQRFDRIDCFTPKEGPMYKCEVVLSPVKGVKLGFWDARSH